MNRKKKSGNYLNNIFKAYKKDEKVVIYCINNYDIYNIKNNVIS